MGVGGNGKRTDFWYLYRNRVEGLSNHQALLVYEANRIEAEAKSLAERLYERAGLVDHFDDYGRPMRYHHQPYMQRRPVRPDERHDMIVTCKFAPSQLADLDRVAASLKVSRSQVIRESCRLGIDAYHRAERISGDPLGSADRPGTATPTRPVITGAARHPPAGTSVATED